MQPEDMKDVGAILETDLPGRAMRKAVREAVLRHKLLGQPIAVGRDGKVVWIPPEEIEIPPPEEDPPA